MHLHNSVFLLSSMLLLLQSIPLQIMCKVWIWELDYKESWAPKNWCFWTMVLEKTLESPLDCKEIKAVHPKGNQFWIFIWRTDVEAETPILWPPDAKSWLNLKRSWYWERLRAGRDRDDRGWDGWMHHWLNRHEFG